MAQALEIEPRGLKRICANCGTHFYDFNRRPIICPNCETEFSAEAKPKTRRGRPPAAAQNAVNAGAAAGVADKAQAEDENDIASETDSEDIDSLEDIEEDGEDIDDDSIDLDGDMDDLDALDDDLDDSDDDDLDIDVEDEKED